MKHPALPLAVALAALLTLAACGSGTTTGSGNLVVTGLAPNQQLLCSSGQGGPGTSTVLVLGSGFVSEHGTTGLICTWTATDGSTPFDAGTSATTQTSATVLSDTQIEAVVPNGVGIIDMTVTVTLPGGSSGSSPIFQATIGGTLVGPFAATDFYQDVTGNVPFNVGAPGLLENDFPTTCAEEDEIPEKPAAGASTNMGNLVVIAPPVGFEDDATPGVAKMSQLGGTVIVQADGSFTYSPPTGVTGQLDSFFYWIEEPGRPSDRSIVFIDLQDIVWFIDNNATGANDGHFNSPFQSIDDFMAAQNGGANLPAVGHTIFVYSEEGSDPYDGMLGLLDQQRLIGERSGLVMNGTPIVPPGPAPTLTNSDFGLGENPGDTVVQLGGRNEVRGIDVRAPAAFGILGFLVDGPIVIDEVDIRGVGAVGILIDGLDGTASIGATGTQSAPRVVVNGSASDAIVITGGFTPALTLPTASVAGTSATVSNASVDGAGGAGVFASNVDLTVQDTTIDNAERGIWMQANNFGTCTFNANDCVLGNGTANRFRGIQLDPSSGSTIVAALANCESHSNEEALRAGSFTTGANLQIAFDNCTWQNLITGNIPAVRVLGASSTITSMSGNTVIGNNTGGGMWFDICHFDADLNTAGDQAVPGGVTRIGTSSAARVEDTALGLFSCTGALTFTSMTIFQDNIGNPNGYANTGTLVLDLGTLTVDVLP